MGFFPASNCTICNYFEPCEKCLLIIDRNQQKYLNQTIYRKLLTFKNSIKNFKNNSFVHLGGIISKNLWQLQLEINTLKKILKPFYLIENINPGNFQNKCLYFDKNPLLCLIQCIRSIINLQKLIIPLLMYRPKLLKLHLKLLLYLIFEESLYITTTAIIYKPFFNDVNILNRLRLENLNFDDRINI